MDNQYDWQVFRDKAITGFSLDLNDQQLNKFRKLYELLTEANKVINLTRITNFKDFCTLHLLDSLTLAPYLKPVSTDFQLMDIGSGAGFPILPLAIIFPQFRMVAVESVQKKAKFIEHASKELGLSKVMVVAERSETLAHDLKYRERFDTVTARAVSSLNTLCELCLPFLKTGGVFLAMKTMDTIQNELQKAEHALDTLGGRVEKVDNILTCDLSNHCIVVIRKVMHTQSKYPRKAGIPAKKPL